MSPGLEIQMSSWIIMIQTFEDHEHIFQGTSVVVKGYMFTTSTWHAAADVKPGKVK